MDVLKRENEILRRALTQYNPALRSVRSRYRPTTHQPDTYRRQHISSSSTSTRPQRASIRFCC